MFDNSKPLAPTQGYILPKWDKANAYRATAIAYLQSEEVAHVEHSNGHHYSLKELQEATIG